MAWISRLTSSASSEPDDLEQVASEVGSDDEDLGWVGSGFKIDDGEDMDMVEDVADGVGVDAVLVGGSVDLTSQYCIT